MKLYFHRTGGLEGSTIEKSIDSNSINQTETEYLEKLIRDSNFFDIPSEIKTERSYPDAYRYKIIIDNGIKTHTLMRTDTNIESTLYPLVKYFLEM